VKALQPTPELFKRLYDLEKLDSRLLSRVWSTQLGLLMFYPTANDWRRKVSARDAGELPDGVVGDHRILGLGHERTRFTHDVLPPRRRGPLRRDLHRAVYQAMLIDAETEVVTTVVHEHGHALHFEMNRHPLRVSALYRAISDPLGFSYTPAAHAYVRKRRAIAELLVPDDPESSLEAGRSSLELFAVAFTEHLLGKILHDREPSDVVSAFGAEVDRTMRIDAPGRANEIRALRTGECSLSQRIFEQTAQSASHLYLKALERS